jgi:Uma2 family endonuclease
MTNPAINGGYKEYYKTEKHDGTIIAMAPSPGMKHGDVINNIYKIFDAFLRGKKCKVFNDKFDVHLTKDDVFVPDVMIICNKNIVKERGIYGAPDLIVEVLSPRTMKTDKVYKKGKYEKYGVKEYWIVDTNIETVEINLLVDGKYILHDIHSVVTDEVYEEMTEPERAMVTYEFSPATFPEMVIKVADIFAEYVWE